MTLTAQGLSVLRGADYLQLIRDRYESLTGLTINWDRDLFLGNITVIMADQLGDLGQLEQAIYDARDINNAIGVQLEQICAQFGIARIPATFSTVSLTFMGTIGAAVPSGTIASGGGSDNFARWSTLTNAVIGASGTVTVMAQALEAGRTVATTGSITIVSTPRSGVNSVTNPTAAVPGADIETDAALRARLRGSQQSANAGTPPAIRRSMLALPDVQQAVVLENLANTPQSVLGLMLQPHAVGIVVFPIQDTAAKRTAISLAIYNDGPRAGLETNGSEVGIVMGQDGVDKEVRWSHAATTTVALTMSLTLDPGFTVDIVRPSIQSAIDAINTLQLIGQPVRRNVVLCAILAINGIADLTTLAMNGVEADYITGALEIAQLNITSIT